MIESSELGSTTGGLRNYLDVLRRRKWIVILITALAIAAALGLSKLQQPKYEAVSKIVIGQGRSLFQVQFGNSIQPFTATMSDLITSNVVASTVIQRLSLDETPESLLQNVTVSINPQTAVLRVSVIDHEPDRARRINDQIGIVFSELVKQRFGSQPVPATAGQAAQPPLTATVFDPAHVRPGQVSPKPVRNAIIAAFLGLVLGLLAAFLREHFDRALRTREAVEASFGLPVIGQVPFERKRRKDSRVVVWEGFGEIAEAYRGLRANLQYLGVSRPLGTILVTSASPEQGKTTVTANLAVAIARSGASTIAVEGDLRRPALDGAFGVGAVGPGLTSVLVGAAEADDVVREVTPQNGATATAGRLSFMPSGPLPPNPSELLSSTQMTNLLDRLGVTYDYVLVDSPPLLLVADALELTRLVDGVILVVRRNRATTDEAREVRSLVERLNVHLVGVVFTDVEPLGSYGTYGEPVREEIEGAKSLVEPRARPAAPEPAVTAPAAAEEDF